MNSKWMKNTALCSVASFLTAGIALNAGAQDVPSGPDPFGNDVFEGAVYAMSNDVENNTIVAYGRFGDGTLSLIGEFDTNGEGSTDFDGAEGLDPLISAYSILLSDDRSLLFAVSAGSDEITSFIVEDDLSLDRVDTDPVNGTAPNSVAYRDGILFVSTIDADGDFTGEPDQEGAIEGFIVTEDGRLSSIEGSRRVLGNRPSAIQFSPDGRFLVVSSINAGSSGLASGSEDEIVVYGISREGIPTELPISAATSTLRGNEEGRNLPSAIGFEIVEDDGRQFVVVTEAREFTSEGAPPAFPTLQTGSVSTWELGEFGDLTPISLDVLAGNSFTDGERTACWIEFSDDGEEFWVSNAIDGSLSSYSFNEGVIELIDIAAAQGAEVTSPDPAIAFGEESDGFIDLWLSDNGEYLYQLLGLRGGINVYATGDDGSLTLIQEVSGNLPGVDSQGIVAF